MGATDRCAIPSVCHGRALRRRFRLPEQQPISQDPHYYYSCILHWAWGRHWVLANAAGGLGDSPGAILMALVWLVAVAVLLVASFKLVGQGPAEAGAGPTSVADDPAVG